jgi:hypothetical protein
MSLKKDSYISALDIHFRLRLGFMLINSVGLK